MSKAIIITDKTRWTSTDWILQNVAASIDVGLAPLSDAKIAAWNRLQPVFDESESVADFSDADSEQMRALFDAARMARELTRANEWHDAPSFPQYISAFDQFIELLAEDHRIGLQRPPT